LDVSGQRRDPKVLYLGKNPVNKKYVAEWAPEPVWMFFQERKNSLPPAGI
jgi:hypothetical protein